MFVFVQIFITLFTITWGADPFCKRHQWGMYCNDDLTGYVKCSGSIWKGDEQVGFRILHSVSCPANTRCSCFAGNDCEGYVQLDEADICKPYEKIHPVKEILYLRYNKNGWIEGDPHADDDHERYTERGEIKQDLRVKSVLYKWKRDDKEKFELIIPDDMGNFTKYSGGYYPNVCEKSTVDNLKVFGGGIKHFTLKNRVTISESFEKQIWESHVYNGDGSGLSKAWTVFANEKRIIPAYYTHQYVGTQEEQCCGYGEDIRYYRVPHDESASTDHWFRVPDFCP